MCPLRSTLFLGCHPLASASLNGRPHRSTLTPSHFLLAAAVLPSIEGPLPPKTAVLLSAPPPLLIKALPSVIAHSAREEMATELALWIRHSVSHSVSHSRRPSVGVPSTLAIDVDTEALG